MYENNFLTVEELAERLKVQKSWIYSRTRETGPGSMPRLKVGKYLRFNYQEVLDWLRKQNEADS
jgi:excisionase family DNA binding protein